MVFSHILFKPVINNRIFFFFKKLKDELLQIDLKDFYTLFYNLLPSIVHDQENVDSYLQCLGLMFLTKKQVGIERTAAYAKRIANLALSVPPNIAIVFLLILHSILTVPSFYSKFLVSTNLFILILRNFLELNNCWTVKQLVLEFIFQN